MNKKKFVLIIFIFQLNLMTAFAQDKEYFYNLVEQLKYSDAIGYKIYDSNKKNVDLSQGSLFQVSQSKKTGSFFAILGDGFVKINSVSTGEEYYTRSGYILFDENFNLLLMPGFELFHNETNSVIKKIEISRKGILKIFFFDKDPVEIKLKLYKPSSESKIECFGNRYYFSEVTELTQESEFIQGFLEMSNVDKTGVLLELQNVLLRLALNKIITQEAYQYDLMLCNELFFIYQGFEEKNLMPSFSKQTIINQDSVYAMEILQMLTLE